MKNLKTTTMRDVIQKAIIYLKFTDSYGSNINALYDLALMLSVGGNTIQLELDSNKDIIDVLETILKEKGFSPLDLNCTKFNHRSIITIRLNSVVR